MALEELDVMWEELQAGGAAGARKNERYAESSSSRRMPT